MSHQLSLKELKAEALKQTAEATDLFSSSIYQANVSDLNQLFNARKVEVNLLDSYTQMLRIQRALMQKAEMQEKNKAAK
ncbi:hypothetical protein B7494_g8588 [Chlorociboria aeruginascens]|nr:hypothetical protein B7494_g8588 [Chlorociboria aeruginascens]